MIKSLIVSFYQLIKLNNPFFLIFFIMTIKPFLYYYILFYFFLSFIATIKFCWVLFYSKKLSPNKNVLDNIIFRIIILIRTKKNYKEILFYFIFAYCIIFILGVSLKSIFISARLYNELKFCYYTQKYTDLLTKIYRIEFPYYDFENQTISFYTRSIIVLFQTYNE